jgi:hypothetical protein
MSSMPISVTAVTGQNVPVGTVIYPFVPVVVFFSSVQV